MNLINQKIEAYCTDFSLQPSADCKAIYDYTTSNFEDSQMLIGPLEAGFLGLLIKTIRAERILEIGCYTGYSALAMAEQLPENGRLMTIDHDAEKGNLAKKFWNQSKHGYKINLRLGNALDLLLLIKESFDLIFIDADKHNYISYLDMVLPMMTDKGIVVADNTLWYGTVIDPGTDDLEGQSIKRFNEYVRAREDLMATIIPMRDGLTVIRKEKQPID